MKSFDADITDDGARIRTNSELYIRSLVLSAADCLPGVSGERAFRKGEPVCRRHLDS